MIKYHLEDHLVQIPALAPRCWCPAGITRAITPKPPAQARVLRLSAVRSSMSAISIQGKPKISQVKSVLTSSDIWWSSLLLKQGTSDNFVVNFRNYTNVHIKGNFITMNNLLKIINCAVRRHLFAFITCLFTKLWNAAGSASELDKKKLYIYFVIINYY